MVVLRILHIAPGAVWVGTVLFMTVVLEPAMRKVGPDVARGLGPHMINSAFALAMGSAGLTIVIGLILVERTPGRDFGQLFANDWGWMIGIGLIMSVIGIALGVVSNLAQRQIIAIGRSLQGPPTPQIMGRIAQLQGRSRNLARTVSVLVLVAVALMAAARWV
jgi:uncharacterized membrane protein